MDSGQAKGLAPGERRRHAKWILSGALISAAVGFASNLVLVRFIGPEGFGRFAIAAATLGVIFSVCTLRLNILIVSIPDAEFDAATRRRFHQVVLQETLSIGAVAGLWLLLTGLWSTWNGVLWMSMTLGHFVANHKALYERQMPYVRLATLDTVSRSAAHGLAVVVAATGALQEEALYLRELVVVIIAAVWLRLLGQMRPVGWALPSWRVWRNVLRQASAPWADGVLESLFDRLRILLAAAVGGERGAGLFFQAHRLAIVPHQLLQPLMGRLALNWFSRESDPAKRVLRRGRLIAIGAAPLLLAAVVVVALADPIVPFVFGEPWRPVVPILVMLAGAVCFNSLFATHKMFAFAARRTRVLLLARGAQFIGLGLPLLPLLWGKAVDVKAVGLGVSLAYCFAFLSSWIGFKVTDARGKR